MSNIEHNCGDFSSLGKKQLRELKTKAMRSGAWFKALQRIDRVLFDLTIRVVDNIRSAKLAKSLFDLTKKLEEPIKNSFSNRMKKIGLPLAQNISLIAKKSGHASASSWAFDSSFAVFLALMQFNQVKIFTR